MTAAWAVPFVTIALTQTAVIATSIYLHRALAHRSLDLHPIADVAFRVALWLTTGQCRRQWVAVHRKHHTFTDRPGDPHSPRLLGFWRVQLFNVAYYMREARNAKTLEAFAPDLQPDRLDRLLFSRGYLGIGIGLFTTFGRTPTVLVFEGSMPGHMGENQLPLAAFNKPFNCQPPRSLPLPSGSS